MAKRYTAFTTLTILRANVFSEKDNLPGLADQLVLLVARLGSDQREDPGSVGRRDRDPAVSVWYAVVSHQANAKTAHVEVDASVLVPHKNRHVQKPKVRVLTIQPKIGSDTPES
jgi:hypothetical protein